jgi:hypothetical protein
VLTLEVAPEVNGEFDVVARPRGGGRRRRAAMGLGHVQRSGRFDRHILQHNTRATCPPFDGTASRVRVWGGARDEDSLARPGVRFWEAVGE